MDPSPARLVGWGAALPDKVLTNADLEATLDTSDEWIVERTGIRERRIGGSTSTLAIDAGRAALDRAGVGPEDIDLVLLCTCTPDDAMPATSSVVQDALGIRAGAMDLNAACAGFVYGLVVADGLLRTGMERILLIGAEALSKVVDWTDRSTAILFGDGAGAVVVEKGDGAGGLLGYDLGSDGSLRHILHGDVGGFLQMDGPEVFRRAVRIVVETSERALARAATAAEEVALFVPHQANSRIIASAATKLGIDAERTLVNIDRTGNTSSASIPIALSEAAADGRLRAGDRVLLAGFGAGMTWAAAVVEWAG